MELPTMTMSLAFSLTFYTLLLLKSLIIVPTLAATLGNETDKLALLKFKSQLTDYSPGVLPSWNESLHFCEWFGVTCSRKHQRVTGLDLSEQKLVGHLSPYIGNLSFLRYMNLANNSFHGGIPPEIGHLFLLQNLSLSNNFFDEEIPASLCNCSHLMNLDLVYNFLKRQIPSEIGSFPKLVILSLDNNNLTGGFPASLGNLSTLQELSLSYNNLEGEIPESISRMTSLRVFKVAINSLSGVFPPSLYNLSSLVKISLTTNRFFGNLRPDIGIALPNLKQLFLGNNEFSGTIPASLSNASALQGLDITENNFTGNIPLSFGNLQYLSRLNVGFNFLGNNSVDDLSSLSVLTNCSQLQHLLVNYNRFAGEFPNFITNLSIQLTTLLLGGNFIRGSIPTEISNLAGLTSLQMEQNLLTGNIPASIGKLLILNELSLGENKLTGEIPSSFGNISRLLSLYLYNNSLEGSIPPSLGNCSYLLELRFCHNKLSGNIPRQLIGLLSLSRVFNVSHNSLTGPLPKEVGNLEILGGLDVSYNKLSGEIPSSLKSCYALEELYMQGNFFEGTIPDLSGLKGIQYLDLSNNNLSGQIPKYMANYSLLKNLNLTFNNFEGDIPVQGIFQNASAFQVYGNSKLCGGIKELQFPPCPMQRTKKPRNHMVIKLIIVIVIAAVCLASFLCLISLLCLRKLKKNNLSTSSSRHFFQKVSYEELLNATGGFSLSNFIGSGSFGIVYKGNLGPGEKAVAVKVLNLQQHGASKSFIAECQSLRNIRHRNLIKILTACSSIDFEGNEFKALVYEFMPNGSLEKWLHPEEGEMHLRRLHFLQRINIAIDVASALLYLHHHCQIPVVHCDLKPSNVLLDNDLVAHVSDFGLARLLSKSGKEAFLNEFSSAGVTGTIGYAAPEYGLGGQLSTSGDVYSFGILLLEMFTGKRPTDELFIDDLNLHNFVKLSLPDRVMEIVDHSLLFDEVGKNKDIAWTTNISEQIQCLALIFRIGIFCSEESPRDRMNMREAVFELISTRDRWFLGTGVDEDKSEGLS